MTKHGLTNGQLDVIKHILSPFAYQIDQVGLFGSRATGTYRENSDIDLVIYGQLNKDVADRLWTLFDESNLPMKIDVHVYELITYPPLKEHIDAAMCPLFLKAGLLGF